MSIETIELWSCGLSDLLAKWSCGVLKVVVCAKWLCGLGGYGATCK